MVSILCILRLHRMHERQPIVTDVHGVCPSVCLSIARINSASLCKKAELTEVLFGVNTLGGPVGVLIPPQRRRGKAAPKWATSGKMVKWILLCNRSSDLAEVLNDGTYERPRKSKCVNLETGNRIPPPGDVFPVGLVNVVNGSVGTVTSRHHTGHRGGPAIVTSHTDDALFTKFSPDLSVCLSDQLVVCFWLDKIFVEIIYCSLVALTVTLRLVLVAVDTAFRTHLVLRFPVFCRAFFSNCFSG